MSSAAGDNGQNYARSPTAQWVSDIRRANRLDVSVSNIAQNARGAERSNHCLNARYLGPRRSTDIPNNRLTVVEDRL
jgi:hypothetical protein